MLKLFGVFLIILAGTGMGLEKSAQLTRREKCLTELIQMVLLLSGEIRCSNASLSDAFRQISRKLSGDFAELSHELSMALAHAGGASFGEIFRECAAERNACASLSGEEQEAFLQIGDHLGYLDREMQLTQLALCREELERLREELRMEMSGKKKIYRGLGLFGGMLLSVLIW